MTLDDIEKYIKSQKDLKTTNPVDRKTTNDLMVKLLRITVAATMIYFEDIRQGNEENNLEVWIAEILDALKNLGVKK